MIARWRNRPLLAVIEKHGRTDMLMAARALERMPPRRPDWDAVVARAYAVVDDRWRDILRLSDALLKAPGGRLGYDEVRQLLAQQPQGGGRSPRSPAPAEVR